MTHNQLKGALLEYLIRRLLTSCGFIQVQPDGHYIFQQNGNGLFYINGKGAAHDADVLMEPPIQMPFNYPSRLLFECKAYKPRIGLGVLRNALGLRYDINEFEIITDESIEERKNNRRANYAIANRVRYNYQVGVASVSGFGKVAIEFAANNKIPLIDLNWLLSKRVCDLFDKIDAAYIKSLSEDLRIDLYTFFKSKNHSHEELSRVMRSIEADNVIWEILFSFDLHVNRSCIGLLETGDLIFLFANQENSFELLRTVNDTTAKCKLTFDTETPNIWYLEVIRNGNVDMENPKFRFFVPEKIMQEWKEYNLDRNKALDIKENFFSRIFVFRKSQDINESPFLILNIDRLWLESIRNSD